MTKLTAAQLELLTHAGAAEGGALQAPEGAKSTIAALIKRGFLISVPRSDSPSQLLITAAGRQQLVPAPAGYHDEPEASLRSAETEEPPTPPAAAPKGKIAILLALLRRPGGASVPDMMEATGWQAHSVRGAMSGSIKKALGHEVASEKTADGRTYHVALEAKA